MGVKMRVWSSPCVATLGLLLAGCASAPRAQDGPFVIPHEIAWRYAMSCVELAGENPIAELRWTNDDAEVHLEPSSDPSIETAAIELAIEGCLSAQRYEERVVVVSSVYKRALLYDYYLGFTIPCLSRQGIEITPLPREFFLMPDSGDPWNPYLGMDVSFDRLIELYRLCPPSPDYLD